MRELIVDFITSLDGYAAAKGWPRWWGLEGPEYLGWLEEQPEASLLMGANTYRLMSSFAAGATPAGTDEFSTDEEGSINGLTAASKVVFSSTLEEPLSWANTTPRTRRRCRSGARDEGGRARPPEHDRQHQPMPVAAASRTRRPVPGRDVPSHHRRHRLRTHLRRLPRRRARHDRQPNLR